MAAPSLRASSTTSQTGSGTITFTIPAAVALGDLMLAAFGASAACGAATVPSGWLRVPRMGGLSGVNALASGKAYAFYKIATAEDTGGAATAAFSFANGGTNKVGVFAAYKDVNQIVPFGSARMADISDDTGIPSGYPITADSLGLWIEAGDGGVDESTMAFSGGAAANWAERICEQNSTGNGFAGIADNSASFTAASRTGVGSTTRTLFATTVGAGVTLVLNPVTTAPIAFGGVTGANAGSTVTNLDSSGGYETGDGPSFSLLPGVIFFAQWAVASETADLTGATLTVNGAALTEVDDTPYDCTGTDTLSVKIYKLAVDESMCWNRTTTEVVRAVSDTATNFSLIGIWVAPHVGSFAVTDTTHSSEASNTNAPNPPSAVVAAYHAVLTWAVCASATGTTATPPSGYTFRAQAKNSSASAMHSYAASKILGAAPSSPEDPGAWAATDTDQFALTTLTVGVLSGSGGGQAGIAAACSAW